VTIKESTAVPIPNILVNNSRSCLTDDEKQPELAEDEGLQKYLQ
jgi:hypothetical protein